MHIRFKAICFRWSFVVPILFYTCFCGLIWTLTLPLKSSIQIANLEKTLKEEFDKSLRELPVLNDNLINSVKINNNIKSADNSNSNAIAKNEYLININDNEYENKDPKDVLEEVFRKADTNKDNTLNPKELASWINMKIIQHISAAVRDNFGVFMQIDINPRNGVVTWDEYHAYFLRKRGFDNKYVENHDEKRHKGLERSIKEQIMRDKASWMEAARSDPDSLTVDEFLAFTHPESSAANLLTLVDELYDRFDRNGDEVLTEDEFAVLHTDGGEDDSVVVRQGEKERREEFKKSVDTNGDGRADRRELLHYVAPQSPRHSEHEAEALLALADTDNDQNLSLSEILAHSDLFLRSKMVDRKSVV